MALDTVYGDPQWQHDNPSLISKFSQLLVNSGIIPDAGTLQRYGLSGLFDPTVATAAASNPYSTAALLKNQLSGSLTANGTTAASRGALFSGAFQNMQDQAGRNYQQAYAQAGANTLSGLLGIQGQQNDLYNTIFQRQANAPVAPDATAYSAPAASTATMGAGMPVPQTPYQRTGPETPGAVTRPPKARTAAPRAGFSARAL